METLRVDAPRIAVEARRRALLVPLRFQLLLLTTAITTLFINGLVEIHNVAMFMAALVAILQLPTIWRTSSGGSMQFACVLGLLTAVSFVSNPSVDGFYIVQWFLVFLNVTMLVAQHHLEVLSLLRVSIAAHVVQAAICAAQFVSGEAIGLAFLGERTSPFAEQSPFSPTGTHYHSYPIASFGLVLCALSLAAGLRGELGRGWSVVGSTTGVFLPILSVSRSALVTVLLLVPIALVALIQRNDDSVLPDRRSRGTLILPFLAVAIGTTVLIQPALRSEVSLTSGASAEKLSTGRVSLVKQSIAMIRDYPLGVGPGNYTSVLARRPDIRALSPDPRRQPVHNVPLMIATEVGVQGAAIFLTMMVAFLIRIRRTGRLGLLVAVAPVPFFLLDPAFWQQMGGLFYLGMWMGYLLHLAKVPRSVDG